MSNKIDSSLMKSPVEELCGNPRDLAVHNGVADGEPGMPGRSKGTKVPERAYDSLAGAGPKSNQK